MADNMPSPNKIFDTEQTPYTDGLTTEAREWYNRYLAQGYAPEVCRLKAIEHMEPPKDRPGGSNDPLIKDLTLSEVRRYRRSLIEGYGPFQAIERAIHCKSKLTNHLKNIKKQVNANAMYQFDLSREDIVFRESIRLAALPMGYPYKTFTNGELEILMQIIDTQIKAEIILKLQFNRIFGKEGLLLFDCRDSSTAEWVERIIPELNEWKGRTLYTSLEFEIPQGCIELRLSSVAEDIQDILKMIAEENEGINTAKWRVINCTKIDDATLLNVRIDFPTLKIIIDNCDCLFYEKQKVNVSYDLEPKINL